MILTPLNRDWCLCTELISLESFVFYPSPNFAGRFWKVQTPVLPADWQTLEWRATWGCRALAANDMWKFASNVLRWLRTIVVLLLPNAWDPEVRQITKKIKKHLFVSQSMGDYISNLNIGVEPIQHSYPSANQKTSYKLNVNAKR